MVFELGAGFVFIPSDRDLLKSFLKPKVNGEALDCDFVVEKQIYGPLSNPWDVLDDASTPWIISGDSQKTAYVFTRLDTTESVLIPSSSSSSSVVNNKSSSKSSGGVRRKQCVRRRAGCGSWNEQTGRLPIMDDNNKNLLGIKRKLKFRINDITGAVRDNVGLNRIGNYQLHEYVLSGCQDYALCKITLDTSVMPKVVNLYRQDVSDITRSMHNLSCLGKRKPSEAQDLCSGPSKMICM